jgi:protein-S-isoprenylcysteine O-methyltransferase Ste14
MTAAGRITPPVGIQPPGARIPGVPPPLYFGAAFAAGMLLPTVTVPLSVGARPPTLAVAAFLLVSGTALAVAGVIEVLRHQTTIVPHRAVSALVTTGPYRITRNPMYTGLATAYLGCALLTGSWWPVATLPFALVAVGRVVIGPEERYLANRFGHLYSNYRTQVRRWL